MDIVLGPLAHRLGSRELSAADLELIFAREPGTVQSLCGVTKLHRIADGEDLVSLAAQASLDVLEQAGLPLKALSGIFSSCNPTTEFLMPTLAPLVAAKIGVTHLQACQIGMGCAGGVQALQAAYNQLVVDSLRGKTSYYLVVAGDHISRMLNHDLWKTAILFSDGVSAALVSNDPRVSTGYVIESAASETYAGESVCVINLPNVLAMPEGAPRSEYMLHMQGRGVFEFGTRIGPRVRALAGMEDFSDAYIIPHQANIRMLNELIPAFEIRPDQLYTDGITKIGNISGAACFIGLEDMIKRNLNGDAKTVLLSAFGAELQVAVAVLRKR